MEVVVVNEGNKNDVTATADSPTSVLKDEEICAVKEEEKSVPEATSVPLDLEANNGDMAFITVSMEEEEEKLIEDREKQKEEIAKARSLDPNFKFSKLDALLTQTQLYSEFLLEKMDDITANVVEMEEDDKEVKTKRGRGRKRKCTSADKYNDKKAKIAVEAMLTRKKDSLLEDSDLTESERVEKEQRELVPLLTGGKLKPYQLKGVKWMISLWQNGLNGILADQMGLGKTIQTIAFLAHLKGKGLEGPFMVIAPLSTLSNWINEVARFAPSINALLYHGTRKEREEMRRKYMPRNMGSKFPLVITSFDVALADGKSLAKYKWKYVIVDEGHRLKNTNCKLIRELRAIPIENKLLLTGTPLQNNLAELWSLLNFILPDIFSSHSEFESWFDLSGSGIGNDEDQQENEEKTRVQVVSKLHTILRPFLLRRMKDDVEKDLPRKKEIILYANMTNKQKELQDHLINKTFENYVQNNEEIVMKPGMRAKLNNLFIQLRKNCASPDLLDAQFDTTGMYPPIEKIVEDCAKFQLLERLLNVLLPKKHKVLIFSQWTRVLDLMDYFLSERGLDVCRIDGSVRLDHRRHQIDAFNDMNSDVSVFILSTRAGGLGINLTAADTCILYDSDWNPQMDMQAMDRCHRIGQTKPVHVYRLATSNSIEGRIIKKAFGKLRLEHVVIGKGQFQQDGAKQNTLDDSEVLALLKDEQNEEDKFIQTDISDEDLTKVMDRSDLIGPAGNAESPRPVPLKGPGWEVVIHATSGNSVLSAVNT